MNMKSSKTIQKRSLPAKLLRIILTVFLVILLAVVCFFAFLSITEFKPKDHEDAAVSGEGPKELKTGEPLTVMSWNIGYGALGDNADFFMDGGTSVQTADRSRLDSNLAGILKEIRDVSPDLLLLQEVDRSSARSHNVNEYELIRNELTGCTASFANNFKVAFLPYPIPPIGKVDSGIASFTAFPVSDAARVQLPVPFKWPVSMVNLKRCLLIEHIPVAGSDRQLALINLHLEAYDDGEGKAAQTKMLEDILLKEQEKGNYVIAGGDFNQIFSSADTGRYPAQEGKWQAGEIDVSGINGDWQFLMDEDVPSCRSLDQPYAGADKEAFQYYLIDGFIVSGNISVESAETADLGFICSDHNPVVLRLSLE